MGWVGGNFACDGAMRLQGPHESLVCPMSLVIPGQKIDCSALAIIADVPWCAACRAERQSFLRDAGMTSLSFL